MRPLGTAFRDVNVSSPAAGAVATVTRTAGLVSFFRHRDHSNDNFPAPSTQVLADESRHGENLVSIYTGHRALSRRHRLNDSTAYFFCRPTMARSKDESAHAKTPSSKTSKKKHVNASAPARHRRPSYSSLSFVAGDPPPSQRAQPTTPSHFAQQKQQQPVASQTPKPTSKSSPFSVNAVEVLELSPMLQASLYKPSVMKYARDQLQKRGGMLKGNAVAKYLDDVRAHAKGKGLLDTVTDECVREAMAAVPGPGEKIQNKIKKDSQDTCVSTEAEGSKITTFLPAQYVSNDTPGNSKEKFPPTQKKKKKRKRAPSVGDSAHEEKDRHKTALEKGTSKTDTTSTSGTSTKSGEKAKNRKPKVHDSWSDNSDLPPKKKLKRYHVQIPAQGGHSHKVHGKKDKRGKTHHRDKTSKTHAQEASAKLPATAQIARTKESGSRGLGDFETSQEKPEDQAGRKEWKKSKLRGKNKNAGSVSTNSKYPAKAATPIPLPRSCGSKGNKTSGTDQSSVGTAQVPALKRKRTSSSPGGEVSTSPRSGKPPELHVAKQPSPVVERLNSSSKGQRKRARRRLKKITEDASPSVHSDRSPINLPAGSESIVKRNSTPATRDGSEPRTRTLEEAKKKITRLQENSVDQGDLNDSADFLPPVVPESLKSNADDYEATAAKSPPLTSELEAGEPFGDSGMSREDQSPEKKGGEDLKAVELETTPPPSDSNAEDSEYEAANMQKAVASESDSAADTQVSEEESGDEFSKKAVDDTLEGPEPLSISQLSKQRLAGAGVGTTNPRSQAPYFEPSILKLLPAKSDELPAKKLPTKLDALVQEDSESESESSSSSSSDSDSGSDSDIGKPGPSAWSLSKTSLQAGSAPPPRLGNHVVQQADALQTHDGQDSADDSTNSSDTESELSAMATQTFQQEDVARRLSGVPAMLSPVRPGTGEEQESNPEHCEDSDKYKSSDEEPSGSPNGKIPHDAVAKPTLGRHVVEQPEQRDAKSEASDDSETSEPGSPTSGSNSSKPEATVEAQTASDPEAISPADADAGNSKDIKVDDVPRAEKKSQQRKLKGAIADRVALFGANSPALEEDESLFQETGKKTWAQSAALSSRFNTKKRLPPLQKQNLFETAQSSPNDDPSATNARKDASQAPGNEDQLSVGFSTNQSRKTATQSLRIPDPNQPPPPESPNEPEELKGKPFRRNSPSHSPVTRSQSRMKRMGSGASASSSAFTGPSRRGSNESTGSRPGLRSFSRKQSSVSEVPKSSALPTSERGPVGRFVCVRILKKPRNPQDDEVLMYDLQDLDDEKHSSPNVAQQDASMDDDPDIGKGERQEGLPPEDDRIVDIEVGVKPENHATEKDVPIPEPNDSRDKEHRSPLKNNNEAEQHDVITISSDKSSSEDDSSSEGEQFVRAVYKTPVVSIHRRGTQSSSNSPGRDIDRSRRGTSEEYPWISQGRRDESVRSAKSNSRRSQIPQSELTRPDDVPQIDDVVVAKMQSTPPSPELIRAHSEAGSRASSVDNEPKGFLRPDGGLSAQKRRTGLRSPHFVSTHESRKSKRPPAGTVSSLPFPSAKASRFGLIQEELAHEPFQLLIAVMFLNKTKGSKAIPKFREFIARYPSPDELAHANLLDITSMLRPLGLQNSRAKTLINFAKCWLIDPPQCDRRYRCINYPYKGAQKDIKPGEVLDDVDPRVAAYEVAHLPGCGPYALDSWRIFCRDALRGVALDWKGTGVGDEGFEPEWKKVKPGDKELKAFLKWMWLREGWEWDPKTGERALAKREEIETAEKSWRWDQESGEDVWIEGGMDENEAGEIDSTPLPTLLARPNKFVGSVESDDSTSTDETDHLGDLSDDSQQDNGTCEEDNNSQLVAAQIAHEVDLSQNRPLTQVPATQPSPRSPFPTSIASVIGDDEAMEKATDSEAGGSSPYAPLTGVQRMFTECEKEAGWYFTGEVNETPQPDSPTKRAEREAAKAIAVDKSSPSSPIEYRSDGDGGNEIDEMEGVEDGSARQASPEL